MIKQARKRIIFGIVALLWFVVVISFYYVTHKPFALELAVRFLDAIFQCIIAILVLSVAGGLGSRITPHIKVPPVTLWVLEATIGLGSISLVYLLLGVAVGVNWTISIILCSLLFLFNFKYIFRWWCTVKALPDLYRRSGKLGKFIAWGIGSLFFITLIRALAPPIKFDALVYHLAFPKTYLLEGKIGYISNNMFWGMPQAGEMLYTLAMSLANVEAAGVLGWSFAVLAITGVISYGNDRLGHQAGWVASAALMAGSSLVTLLSAAYIDWLALLFGLGFVISLDNWCWKDEGGSLLMAGAFTGLAFGTKYTAGVLLIAGSVTILWARRQYIRKAIHSFLYYFIAASLISAPWWVKNFVATGNAFYPFFFPSGSMDTLRLRMYSLPPWGDWIEAFLLPWRATITGVEGTPGYSTSIGPLLLALGLLVVLNWNKRSMKQQRLLKTSGFIACLGLLTWAIASRFSGYLIQSRLYFSIFPALAFLAGGGYLFLRDLRFPGVRMARVAGGLISLVFVFSAVEVTIDTIKDQVFEVVLGLETPEKYLDRNLGWFAPTMRKVESLPNDARVVMLWETRSFYCLPRCYPDEVLDRWLHTRNLTPEPREILEIWRKDKFTHLLVYQLGADFVKTEDQRFSQDDWQAFDELISLLHEPEDFGSAYALYSLSP